jgi:hypothetical protein
VEQVRLGCEERNEKKKGKPRWMTMMDSCWSLKGLIFKKKDVNEENSRP